MRRVLRGTRLLLAIALILRIPAAGADDSDRHWSREFVPTGFSGTALTSCVWSGSVVVGGSFTEVNGEPLERLASWDGTRWAVVGGGANGTVRAVLAYGGDLFSGGDFTSIGGQPIANLARWDETEWHSLDDSPNGPVYDLVQFGDYLVAVGSCTTAGLIYSRNAARWDGTRWYGAAVTPLDGGTAECAAVYYGALWVGGTFPYGGGIARWGTAWSSPGGGFSTPDCPGGGSERVHALKVWDNRLFAAGRFTGTGGPGGESIASWDGTEWQFPGAGVVQECDEVFALEVFDGSLVAAGDFDAASTSGLTNIARWDGASWWPLGEGIGTGVHSLLAHDGILHAFGDFTTADGHAAGGLARWTGNEWLLRPGLGKNGTVWALSRWQGNLVAAGTFAFAGPTAVARVRDGTVEVGIPWETARTTR